MPKKGPSLSPQRVQDFLDGLFADDLHAKRIRSLADGTVGILQAGSLGKHAIGRGLAAARGSTTSTRSNRWTVSSATPASVWELLASWVPHVLGERKAVFVNLDWTEFEPDDQAMIVASIQTEHGRSTPLAWLTGMRGWLSTQA